MNKNFSRSFMNKNGKDPNDDPNKNLWDWFKKKEKESDITTSFEITTNNQTSEIQNIIDIIKKDDVELSEEATMLIGILEDNIQTVQ